MDESLADLDLFGGSLVVSTVTNTLFPPFRNEEAADLDKVLFLDESSSGYRLSRKYLMQTTHVLAKAIRDNRGIAYAWAPFRKGDSAGVVLPGEAEAAAKMPLGWEWSLMEAVIASLAILKAGGTVRLYRAQEGLAEALKTAANGASAHQDISLSKDITVPESPSSIAPRNPNQPPHHPVPPHPRLFFTAPTVPIPHVPNLFYGMPDISESLAWKMSTRPMMDMADRGALLRDEILPTLIPEDGDRWAIWSDEEGMGMKHSEVIDYMQAAEPMEVEAVEVDPVEMWRMKTFLDGVLVPIFRGQTVMFLQPGKSREQEAKAKI